MIRIKPGDDWDRCPYGFTDTIRKQGDELFCSLLYVQASRQLSDLLDALGRKGDAKTWKTESERVAASIREVFWDSKTVLFWRTSGDWFIAIDTPRGTTFYAFEKKGTPNRLPGD